VYFDDGGIHLFFVYPIECDRHVSYIYRNMHLYCVDGTDLISFIDIVLRYMLTMVRSLYGLGYFSHCGS